MKQYAKRILSAGLALLLSASALPVSAFAASDSTSTLADVTAKYIDAENGKEVAESETYSVTHEERQPQEIENYTYVDYTESVEYIYSHKDLTYIVGYPDESVRPDASMTRAEAVTVFYRLYGGEYPAFQRRMSNGTFEDVKTDYWFYKEVETLYNIGIVDGTEEHKFSPDAPVTRAEFAVMAAKFANLDYEGGNIFEDVPAGHWAYSYINAAANVGWVKGYPDGSFRPDEPISRAEVVRLVNGVINRSITLNKLKELGVKCPYNDLVENHWSYCDLMEATVPHSAEEWHGLSYNDGIYNIIVEKFVDQNGVELAESVTTAGKEEVSPKAIPAYEYRGYIRTITYQYTNGDAIPSIEKTADVQTANVGDTLTYTVKLMNDEVASSAWKEVVLTDELPDGLTFVDGSVYVDNKAAQHSFENDLLTVPLGDIAAGQTVTVTFKATVNNDMYNQTVNNTAVAEGTNGTCEDKDDGVVVADGRTDLSVVKTVDKSSAKVGDMLTYTVEVSNGTGAEVNIRDVKLTDTIPGGLTFRGNVTVDGYTSIYAYDNESHVLTVPLDAIAPGQTKTICFDVLVNSSAYGMTIVNTAIASGSNTPDTEDTDDGVTIEDGKADGHAGAKSANKTTARVGDTITYTIMLQNSALATADWASATVTDVLPDGVSFAGNVQKDGRATTEYSHDSSSRTLTLTPYAIAPDTQVVYTFDVTVDEGMQGKYIVNTAILADGDDQTPLPDAGVQIDEGEADPIVTKSASVTEANIGDMFRYEITVKNGDMDRSFDEVWTMAQEHNVSLREAAYMIAIQRVVEAKKIRGVWP